ncbi:hypothetical protein LEP1GSC104_0157 [Leptospira interrogans str. UI 12621]|uniref:Uncharacterized protein n=1 Tax=Leptospira interrogans str. UI 12621 TaxID=1049937 RepID=A0A0F6H4X3_LEPIR|nr:hypothetical protein LEP1GSC104_0157 [Leptospira interrogans str. UI 12621]
MRKLPKGNGFYGSHYFTFFIKNLQNGFPLTFGVILFEINLTMGVFQSHLYET